MHHVPLTWHLEDLRTHTRLSSRVHTLAESSLFSAVHATDGHTIARDALGRLEAGALALEFSRHHATFRADSVEIAVDQPITRVIFGRRVVEQGGAVVDERIRCGVVGPEVRLVVSWHPERPRDYHIERAGACPPDRPGRY